MKKIIASYLTKSSIYLVITFLLMVLIGCTSEPELGSIEWCEKTKHHKKSELTIRQNEYFSTCKTQDIERLITGVWIHDLKELNVYRKKNMEEKYFAILNRTYSFSADGNGNSSSEYDKNEGQRQIAFKYIISDEYKFEIIYDDGEQEIYKVIKLDSSSLIIDHLESISTKGIKSVFESPNDIFHREK